MRLITKTLLRVPDNRRIWLPQVRSKTITIINFTFWKSSVQLPPSSPDTTD